MPAFAAGLGVQVAFSAGMQGFFLAFALWLQHGAAARRGGGRSSSAGRWAQQLGGAVGVALLGTVFFGYLNGHSSLPSWLPPVGTAC